MFAIEEYEPQKHFASTLSLYTSVNWLAYSDNPEKLKRALAKSHSVMVVLAEDKVVGLIRTISDGEVICYVQDILVHPEFQGQGIGTRLMEKVIESNPVRQLVLLTDNEPRQKSFYEKLGFRLVEGKLNSYIRVS